MTGQSPNQLIKTDPLPAPPPMDPPPSEGPPSYPQGPEFQKDLYHSGYGNKPGQGKNQAPEEDDYEKRLIKSKTNIPSAPFTKKTVCK